MLLKLKKLLLFSGLGLITIGAITPIVASCGKSSKNNTDPDFVYTSESVKNLFEQFTDSYRDLPRAEGVSAADVEAEITDFKNQLTAYEAETADLPDNDKFALRSEWIISLAKEYDIILVEWQQVDSIRDSLFEGIMTQGGYDDQSVAAGIYQQELIGHGIETNQSFNEYLDAVADSDYIPEQSNFIDYSPTLFPRTHAYALRSTLSPINNKINAVAAKANLLSQMVYDYLKIKDEESIISYLADSTNEAFVAGALEYSTVGVPLDYAETQTSLVGTDGNYIDSTNTAYRLLTKDAQKALFNYSYLDLTSETGHTTGAFDGTKIFGDDQYDVDIALHVKAPDSDELLLVKNYADFSVTLEYDVVVTDTKTKFSPFETEKERYDDDGSHDIPYFALVGARTFKFSMPTDVRKGHADYYLENTLKYDVAHPETIVNALGVTFSNIKKDTRDADGRPTPSSKLDEEDINHFYFLTTAAEEQEQIVSFTSQYGTNGDVSTVINKWLIPRDADAAVHLQVDGFTNSLASYFGSEYVNTKNTGKAPKSLTLSEANAFLTQVLGSNSLQFGVKIEGSGREEGRDELTGTYVKLGVYLGTVVENPSAGQEPLTNLIPVAAHDNIDKTFSQTTQLDSWQQHYKALYAATSPEYGPNQFYLPLFTSARQASNMKFCAGLLEKDNLAKHAKIMEFIDYPVFSRFAYEIDELLSTNRLYAGLNIVMTVAYAIKLVYDVFILSSCWAIPPLALGAALQIASDLISIGFLIYDIYGTFQLIDKLSSVLDIFHNYIKKSAVARVTDYKIIKDAYDAYLAQLNIYKDVTKSPAARANAADAVANGLYDKFMKLLTDNLFDFVNDSIKLQAGFSDESEITEITPDLGWGAVKGVAELAPFLMGLLLHIIFSVMFIIFVKVAGMVLNKLTQFIEDSTIKLVGWYGADYASETMIAVLVDTNQSESLKLIADIESARSSLQQVAAVKDMMKISGIAGIILGVLNALFTVGYSILTSQITSDVEDLLDAYLIQ